MSESQAATDASGLSADDIARMQFKKKLRRKRRLDREMESQIEGLNIYPMLDMMTIILVFLLKSYSASSVTINSIDSLSPPTSTTTLNPKETIAVTITKERILVDNKEVVRFEGGAVPAALKGGSAEGMLIGPLKAELQKKVDQLKKIASFNSSSPFTGELSIIADQKVKYRQLNEVLYTAGQVELSNYRFIVIQGEGAPAAGAAAPKG